jgi:creatinine amidohydrolase
MREADEMSEAKEVRWERMFPDQLEAAFARAPVLYLPYGMCEPHGPHNALGLDALKAHALCCRAAEAGGGIVAPPEYWHIHEIGHYAAWARREVGEVARHWMTAVPPWVHFKNVCYHVRAAERLGFHVVILLTGHYGPNWEDLKTLVDLLQPRVAARLFGLPDFEANHRGFDEDGRSGADHAGRVETSLLWSLEPECVDASRLPALPLSPAGEVGEYFAMGRDAHVSNRRVGDRMVADEVTFLVAKARELLAAYDQAQPVTGPRLKTFEDVERFWTEVVQPVFPAFKSMKGYHEVTDEVAAIPPDSVWKPASSGPLRS